MPRVPRLQPNQVQERGISGGFGVKVPKIAGAAEVLGKGLGETATVVNKLVQREKGKNDQIAVTEADLEASKLQNKAEA